MSRVDPLLLIAAAVVGAVIAAQAGGVQARPVRFVRLPEKDIGGHDASAEGLRPMLTAPEATGP